MKYQNCFIVNLRSPLCKIKFEEVFIKVCEKRTWAISKNGKRHLLGSSAFFTEDSANICKKDKLEKMLKYKKFLYFNKQIILKEIENKLIHFKKFGTWE